MGADRWKEWNKECIRPGKILTRMESTWWNNPEKDKEEKNISYIAVEEMRYVGYDHNYGRGAWSKNKLSKYETKTVYRIIRWLIDSIGVGYLIPTFILINSKYGRVYYWLWTRDILGGPKPSAPNSLTYFEQETLDLLTWLKALAGHPA